MPRADGTPACGDDGGRKQDGTACGRRPIRGLKRCERHTGIKKSDAKARGAVVVEVMRWGLGDTKVDPGETLLRLLSQSAARVARLSLLLEEAYDAAGRLSTSTQHITVDERDTAASDQAREDLDRIFMHGEVAALIGHTYASSERGVFATGEAIRGLVELEAQERDRCAKFAKLALDAGIAERTVRLAESQAGQLTVFVRGMLTALGHNPNDPQIRALVATQMRAIDAAP